ncbi:SDR family oxidoreductase [Streptomyces sp. NPDC007818]|uniref:SDR family oxidoreductase n=1 Tax=Streptomyces sp. NPDC007818 TaxID=3364780 RepID=UPI0036D14BCE
MSQLTVLVTGASTGIGRLTAQTLADAGHTVYASMRDVAGHNAGNAAAVQQYAQEKGVDLRVTELDVCDQESVEEAAGRLLAAHDRIDVVVHNVGHMTVGPAEAFTPAQLAELFDTNVLGAHRVNRAFLPRMRQEGAGLLVYVGSTTSRMIYPMLGPYCAVKAAFDTLAQAMRFELARYGIEVVTVMPGAFTTGTEHFPKATHPADTTTADAYGELEGVPDTVTGALEAMTPPGAHPQAVADEITRVVGLPAGSRPRSRPMVDFLHDGAEEINDTADALQAVLLERLSLADLLTPHRPVTQQTR